MHLLARAGFAAVVLVLAAILFPAFALAQPANPLDGMGELELVADGFSTLEGPLWLADEGVLLFVGGRDQTVYRLEPSVGVSVLFGTGRTITGLALHRDGWLLIAGGGPGGVTLRGVQDQGGQSFATSATLGGQPFSPNDLVLRSDGTLYVTSLAPSPTDAVYRLGPDGSGAPIWQAQPDARISGPNGIAFSPDESTLYVSYIRTGHIVAFTLAEDGSAVEERVFTTTAPAPDGMCVDQAGNVFVATNAPGVQVFAPDGTLWGLIPVPPPAGERTVGWNLVTNCAFGGTEGKTLYITAQQALYRVQMSIPGS